MISDCGLVLLILATAIILFLIACAIFKAIDKKEEKEKQKIIELNKKEFFEDVDNSTSANLTEKTELTKVDVKLCPCCGAKLPNRMLNNKIKCEYCDSEYVVNNRVWTIIPNRIVLDNIERK